MWFGTLTMFAASYSALRVTDEDDMLIQENISKILSERVSGQEVIKTRSGSVTNTSECKDVETEADEINRMIALYGTASYEAMKYEATTRWKHRKKKRRKHRKKLDRRSEVPSIDSVQDPLVIFVKSNQFHSAVLRADESAYILNNLSLTPAVSMRCKQYRAQFCARTEQKVQIVVHVKYVCACKGTPKVLGATHARHVYDAIDLFARKGGLRQAIKDNRVGVPPCKREGPIIKNSCFSAFLTSNQLMQQSAEDANPDAAAYVVQHHHSNFHNRHRFPSEKLSTTALVGIAGYSRRTVMSDTGKLAYKRVDDLVKSSGCSSEHSLPPFPIADCYAATFQALALGVAWRQEKADTPEAPKAIDNSAQRLLNLFAVGVPAIGHSNYASYREVADAHELLTTTSSETTLQQRLEFLALNQTAYDEASAQALKVAELYSPEATGRRYKDVFSKLGLTLAG